MKWFRTVHPLGAIETTEVCVDLAYPAAREGTGVRGYARFHATVRDAEGRLLGQGTKTEMAANFPDYVEKAETGAIGRALAAAGFGTAVDQELDEGRIVDAPRARRRPGTPSAPRLTTQRAASPSLPPAERVSAPLRPIEPLTEPPRSPEQPSGPTHLQTDVLEWLEQQAKRAGYDDLAGACRELDYAIENVLIVEAMQRSLDKELKVRIKTKDTADAI